MRQSFSSILQKIPNTLLLATVFLLPWQTRLIMRQGMVNGNPSEYLTLSLYGLDIAILISLLVKLFSAKDVKLQTCLVGRRVKNYKLKIDFKFWLGVFIFWCLLSVLWAPDKLLVLEHLAWLLLGGGLAWLVTNTKDKTQLIFWFLMGLLVSAWLGIWQFASQFAFANKWLGLAQHDPLLPGTSIVELYALDGTPLRWLRAYGSFDHPNIFGVLMALGIILAGWLLIRLGNERKAYSFLLLIALFSFTTGLFASLSRSAWLGLVLALTLTFFRLWWQKKRSLSLAYLKYLLPVGIIFATLVFLYPAQFAMRSGGAGRLEQKSVDERALYFRQSRQLIAQHPLVGVGLGNYVETLQRENPTQPAWTTQPVHNVLVLMWAELGSVGLLVVLGMFAWGLRAAWRSDLFALGLSGLLLPTLLLDHWLWSLHFGVLLVGFIAGLSFALNNQVDK